MFYTLQYSLAQTRLKTKYDYVLLIKDNLKCNYTWLKLKGLIKTSVKSGQKKVNKWDPIKLKSFCTAKETVSKVKRQPSESEKIIASETTDKILISKVYKHTTQYQKNKQPNQKVGKRPKQTFLQRRHTDG